MEKEFDITEALKPGVYVLSWRGKVVHVGRAKCMLAAIADHRATNGQSVPDWFPIRGVQFDSICIHPMSYDRTADFARALAELHHQHSRVPHSAGKTSPETFHRPSAPPLARRL